MTINSIKAQEGTKRIIIAVPQSSGLKVTNGVNVNSDGTMTVNNISLSKITQTPGTELILNGGDATVSE